jgi:hypothetical protein
VILLISYDLNGHERPAAYEDVKEMIVAHAMSYKKPLYSQWFVETDETIAAWQRRMKELADSNDYWFIVKVGTDRQGWLPKAVWEWLNDRA